MATRLTLLNSFGDLTVEWSEDDHIEMLKIIDELLDNGYIIFKLEKSWLWKKNVEVQSLQDVKNNVVIPSKTDKKFIEKMSKLNTVKIVKSNSNVADNSNKTLKVEKIVIKPEDIEPSKHYVVTPQPVGG